MGYGTNIPRLSVSYTGTDFIYTARGMQSFWKRLINE